LQFELLYWQRRHKTDMRAAVTELERLRHERTDALEAAAACRAAVSTVRRAAVGCVSRAEQCLQLLQALTPATLVSGAAFPRCGSAETTAAPHGGGLLGMERSAALAGALAALSSLRRVVLDTTASDASPLLPASAGASLLGARASALPRGAAAERSVRAQAHGDSTWSAGVARRSTSASPRPTATAPPSAHGEFAAMADAPVAWGGRQARAVSPRSGGGGTASPAAAASRHPASPRHPSPRAARASPRAGSPGAGHAGSGSYEQSLGAWPQQRPSTADPRGLGFSASGPAASAPSAGRASPRAGYGGDFPAITAAEAPTLPHVSPGPIPSLNAAASAGVGAAAFEGSLWRPSPAAECSGSAASTHRLAELCSQLSGDNERLTAEASLLRAELTRQRLRAAAAEERLEAQEGVLATAVTAARAAGQASQQCLLTQHSETQLLRQQVESLSGQLRDSHSSRAAMHERLRYRPLVSAVERPLQYLSAQLHGGATRGASSTTAAAPHADPYGRTEAPARGARDGSAAATFRDGGGAARAAQRLHNSHSAPSTARSTGWSCVVEQQAAPGAAPVDAADAAAAAAATGPPVDGAHVAASSSLLPRESGQQQRASTHGQSAGRSSSSAVRQPAAASRGLEAYARAVSAPRRGRLRVPRPPASPSTLTSCSCSSAASASPRESREEPYAAAHARLAQLRAQRGAATSPRTAADDHQYIPPAASRAATLRRGADSAPLAAVESGDRRSAGGLIKPISALKIPPAVGAQPAPGAAVANPLGVPAPHGPQHHTSTAPRADSHSSGRVSRSAGLSASATTGADAAEARRVARPATLAARAQLSRPGLRRAVSASAAAALAARERAASSVAPLAISAGGPPSATGDSRTSAVSASRRTASVMPLRPSAASSEAAPQGAQPALTARAAAAPIPLPTERAVHLPAVGAASAVLGGGNGSPAGSEGSSTSRSSGDTADFIDRMHSLAMGQSRLHESLHAATPNRVAHQPPAHLPADVESREQRQTADASGLLEYSAISESSAVSAASGAQQRPGEGRAGSSTHTQHARWLRPDATAPQAGHIVYAASEAAIDAEASRIIAAAVPCLRTFSPSEHPETRGPGVPMGTAAASMRQAAASAPADASLQQRSNAATLRVGGAATRVRPAASARGGRAAAESAARLLLELTASESDYDSRLPGGQSSAAATSRNSVASHGHRDPAPPTRRPPRRSSTGSSSTRSIAREHASTDSSETGDSSTLLPGLVRDSLRGVDAALDALSETLRLTQVARGPARANGASSEGARRHGAAASIGVKPASAAAGVGQADSVAPADAAASAVAARGSRPTRAASAGAPSHEPSAAPGVVAASADAAAVSRQELVSGDEPAPTGLSSRHKSGGQRSDPEAAARSLDTGRTARSSSRGLGGSRRATGMASLIDEDD
jgi:hypothetical protein